MIENKLFKKRNNFSWVFVLDSLVEFFWLFAVFSIPIYFSFFLNTENPFELNKMVLLRVLFALLFIATTIREIFFPSVFIKKIKTIFFKYWLWPSVFILFLFVSLFFSSDFSLSFYGATDRQQGFISYFYYFSWFILLSFNLIVLSSRENKELSLNSDLKTEPNPYSSAFIKRIIYSIIFSFLIVSLYGVFQFLGLDFYSWQEPAFLTKRAFSFLGQPNFFASWLLLVIPIVIFFFLVNRSNKLKIFSLLLLPLSLFALLSSSSRGGMLSLVLAAIVFLFSLFLFSNLKLKFSKKKILLSFSVLLFSLLFALELFLPGRLFSLFKFNEGSVSARLDFYKTSVLAIKERPLTGYGQENLYNVFVSRYEPKWAKHSRINQAPDRVHNIILDILMSAGFLGLIFYFLFYRYYFLLAYRNIKKTKFISLSLFIILGVLAYLLSLLFSFTIVSGEFYLSVFLAILVAINFSLEKDLFFNEKKEEDKKLKKKIFSKSFYLLVSTSIFFLIIASSVNNFLADYYFYSARIRFVEGQLPESMTFLDYIDELKINPVSKSYYASISTEWITPLFPYKEEKVLDSFFRERLETSFNNLKDDQPIDLLAKAKISSLIKESEITNVFLDKIESNYPSWPRGVLTRAKINSSLDKKEEAIKDLNFLLSLIIDPNDKLINEEQAGAIRSMKIETFNSLAEIYESLNDYEQAANFYRLAYLESPLNHQLLKKMADMLYLQEDYHQALIEVDKGMKLSPSDYSWPLLKAYLYQELKDEESFLIWQQKAIDLGYVVE